MGLWLRAELVKRTACQALGNERLRGAGPPPSPLLPACPSSYRPRPWSRLRPEPSRGLLCGSHCPPLRTHRGTHPCTRRYVLPHAYTLPHPLLPTHAGSHPRSHTGSDSHTHSQAGTSWRMHRGTLTRSLVSSDTHTHRVTLARRVPFKHTHAHSSSHIHILSRAPAGRTFDLGQVINFAISLFPSMNWGIIRRFGT